MHTLGWVQWQTAGPQAEVCAIKQQRLDFVSWCDATNRKDKTRRKWWWFCFVFSWSTSNSVKFFKDEGLVSPMASHGNQSGFLKLDEQLFASKLYLSDNNKIQQHKNPVGTDLAILGLSVHCLPINILSHCLFVKLLNTPYSHALLILIKSSKSKNSIAASTRINF